MTTEHDIPSPDGAAKTSGADKPVRRRSRLTVAAAAILLILAARAIYVTLTAPGALLQPSIPAGAEEALVSGRTYPDYDGAVVPRNIAPLNFQILGERAGERYVAAITGEKGRPIVLRGAKVQIPERAWRRLAAANVGGTLTFTCYARHGRKWTAFSSAVVAISEDPVDRWLHYRLIEPSYEFGNVISLNSRDLTNFRERAFVSNESFGQKPCLNCHAFQDRETDRFLFHFRDVDNPANSGTVLYNEGKVSKLPLKTSGGLPCVYPTWRPSGPFVVFSVNQTRQMFHTLDAAKAEVFDLESHLALYDAETQKLTQFTADPDVFDTFPSWAPDGSALYYCSASLKLAGTTATEREADALKRVDEFRYDIKRVAFDEKTRSFGTPEVVVAASSRGKSAVHPRVSPDGRFLIYTECDSGAFPIWHNESDLIAVELGTGMETRLDALNSGYAETFHNWDSSGRWLVYASRRGDGVYTRLWLAHIDASGQASKPFPIPQRDPERDTTLLKSYNVPEFTREPIRADGRKLMKAAKSVVVTP